MNCARCNKLIYLFEELTFNERRYVEVHIQSCEKCALLFAQVKQERGMLKSMYAPKPVTPDANLVNRIMMQLDEKSERNTSFDWIVYFLQRNPVRYAMATISFVLISFFVSEFRQDASGKLINRENAFDRVVKLNSSQFYETLRPSTTTSIDLQEKRVSLYECVRSCARPDFSGCMSCKSKYLNF